MNKLFKLFSICIILLITGCGKQKYVACTIDIKNSQQNYTLTGTYKIYYNKTFVTKIEKEEKYTSDDKNIIDYLRNSNELSYSNLNDLYGGYDYNIKLDKTSLNINAIIDLKNTDIKGMVKNGELNSDYVATNKLTISGAKYLYKEKGAVCSE